MNTETPQLRGKLDAVRVAISRDPNYKVIVALNREIKDIFSTDLPTAGTDGVTHYWNPSFVNDNSLKYIRFVKLHELTHDFLLHGCRIEELIAMGFNRKTIALATDHAVNNFLADCGEEVPEDAVFDRKYKGMSIIDIAYDLKDNEQEEKDNGQGEGEGQGKPTDDHSLMGTKSAEAKAKADKALADASLMEGLEKVAGLEEDEATSQGNEAMKKMMELARDARHKAKDWRSELDEFTGELLNGERISTYAKICRRPLPGLIRPGKKVVGKPHIGVIIDTSGSMFRDLPKVMVELEVLSNDGFTFDVVCCDGEVYGPDHFNAGEFDFSSLHLRGGGGSDMVPAFEKIAEVCPDADALIFCTDGMINWPSKDMLGELPPCLLVQFASTKNNREGRHFYKHILIRGDV